MANVSAEKVEALIRSYRESIKDLRADGDCCGRNMAGVYEGVIRDIKSLRSRLLAAETEVEAQKELVEICGENLKLTSERLGSEILALRARADAAEQERDEAKASFEAAYAGLVKNDRRAAAAEGEVERLRAALKYLIDEPTHPEFSGSGGRMDPIVKHWSHTSPQDRAYLRCPRCVIDSALQPPSEETNG